MRGAPGLDPRRVRRWILAAVVVGLMAACVHTTIAPTTGPPSPTATAVARATPSGQGSGDLPPSASEPVRSPGPSTSPTAGSIAMTLIDQPGLLDGDSVVLRTALPVGSGFTVLGNVGLGVFPKIEAWLTADGRTWERTGVIPSLTDVRIEDAAELPSGRIVGVGHGKNGTTIWSSDDRGRTWQARLPSDDPAATAHQVVASGRGALVHANHQVGQDPTIRDLLWFSRDGATWTAVDMPDKVFGKTQIRAIIATTTGFVAVGGRAPAKPVRAGDLTEYRAAAWLSHDGLAWSAATVADRPMMLGAFAGSDGLIGFGWSDPFGRLQPWTSDTGSTWIADPSLTEHGPALDVHDGVIAWLETSVAAQGSRPSNGGRAETALTGPRSGRSIRSDPRGSGASGRAIPACSRSASPSITLRCGCSPLRAADGILLTLPSWSAIMANHESRDAHRHAQAPRRDPRRGLGRREDPDRARP